MESVFWNVINIADFVYNSVHLTFHVVLCEFGYSLSARYCTYYIMRLFGILVDLCTMLSEYCCGEN